MHKYNDLIEKAIKIIVDRNCATKYLLRKSLNIDDITAEKLLDTLIVERFVSPADSLLRRHVEQKAFDYIRNKNSGNYQDSNKREQKEQDQHKKTEEQPAKNSNNTRSAYDILGVKIGASKKEIDDAYRTMAKMYHPDKVVNLAPEYMEIAERRMKEINIAYSEIKV